MRSLFIAAIVAGLSFSVAAQESCAVEPGCTDVGCGESLPITNATPPWIGDLSTRSALTGDWGGSRSSLAESGITFQGNATQFYMGVADGGRNTGFEYGGHNDYILNFDVEKLGGMKGGFLKVRAEHNYGDSINRAAGSVLPAVLATDLPVADSESVYLTNVLFTQFLSETSAVYFGKLDTLDGDLNAFAHGRGKSQFLNMNFIGNPALLRGIPYSTLGAGALFILGPEDTLNVGVLNAVDTTRTTGFDELFNEGVVLTAEVRFATNIGDKPGHQLIGAAWNSRDFASLQQDPRFIVPATGIPIARQSGTWGIYYNFDQYLVVDSQDPTRGWGVFGRVGISDGNPNPIDWHLSFGIGGNSPIQCRENDTFGLGWYANGISDELGPVATAILGADDGQGIECFYNYAVTPWFHVTPDIQYIHPGAQNVADDALVIGVRAKVDL